MKLPFNSIIYCMPITEGLRLGDMSKGDPVPDGVYHVRINKNEKKRSEPSAKNPDPWEYFNLDYVITGGSPEELHGRHVFEVCTLEPGKNFAARQLATAVLGDDEDIDVVEAQKEGRFNDAELLIAVTAEKPNAKDPQGELTLVKGGDGKLYPPKNKVTKRMPLNA